MPGGRLGVDDLAAAETDFLRGGIAQQFGQFVRLEPLAQALDCDFLHSHTRPELDAGAGALDAIRPSTGIDEERDAMALGVADRTRVDEPAKLREYGARLPGG